MKVVVHSVEVYEVEANTPDEACDKLSDYLSGYEIEGVEFVETFITEAQ